MALSDAVVRSRSTVGMGQKRAHLLDIIGSYLVLIFWSVMVLYPLIWMAATSFKDPIQFRLGNGIIPWVQYQPTLNTWADLMTGPYTGNVMRPIGNTVTIATISAFAALILGALGGYGLSRFRYKVGPMSNADIAFWFISQRMMPPVVVVFPILIFFKWLHLLDTQLGMIIVYTTFAVPLIVWIMRDFFNGVPREIEESALIDGCSAIRTFFAISLPLAAPGLIACFLLALIFAYNDYLFALMLTFGKATTAPVLIYGVTLSGKGIEYWYMSALVLTAVTPLLIVGLFTEKYLARGIVMGSLKG